MSSGRCSRGQGKIFHFFAVTLTCVLSCTGYTEKDGKTYYDGNELGTDGLQILNKDFAKDSVNCYYHELLIDSADAATFVALDDSYAKDHHKVYYCTDNSYLNTPFLSWEPSKERRKAEVIDIADPATFLSLGYGYAKDHSRAYLDGKKFKVRNPASLKVLSKDFLTDSEVAYFKTKPVIGSDGKTFQLLDTAFEGYARDAKFIYFFNQNEVKIIPCNAKTFIRMKGYFSKDDRSVYFRERKLKDTDPNTFLVLDERFSRDKTHVFFNDKVIAEANPTSFVILKERIYQEEFANSVFSKDKQHVFWETSLISGANPQTFKLLSRGYSKDDKNIYYHNTAVAGADFNTFSPAEDGWGDSSTDAKDAIGFFLEGKRVVAE
jgi:hypothetical protein